MSAQAPTEAENRPNLAVKPPPPGFSGATPCPVAPPPGLPGGQTGATSLVASSGASSSGQHTGNSAPAVRPLPGKPPATPAAPAAPAPLPGAAPSPA
eukprot:2429819-Lingulodinium_polyedra.AAC.1